MNKIQMKNCNVILKTEGKAGTYEGVHRKKEGLSVS